MYKTELRKSMEAKRNSLLPEDRAVRSMEIAKSLTGLKAYQKAAMVFIYASFRSEVSTYSMMENALNSGKRVAVPVCIAKSKIMLPCEITSLNDLVPGTWGIPEPALNKRRVIDSSEIDMVIVPGISFDRCYNRLGYGAGYYDRFLPSLRTDAVKIGICYDFQLVDCLPAEEFDIPMDGIITESTVLLKLGVD